MTMKKSTKAEKSEKVQDNGAAVPLAISALKKSDREEYIEYCDRYLALGAEIKELETEKSAISAEVKEILNRAGVAAVKEGRVTVRLTHGERKDILADRLLSQGVSPAIIKKATRVTEFDRLTITAEKEKDGGGEVGRDGG
jgi:predicted phage-related endonuclease